ncbi:MAG: hypothetical protein Q7T51_03350 [Candidatus Moranbacteria bacterium]|nr:hypothetical protein [Candidatus Moranbacteria bacterium]
MTLFTLIDEFTFPDHYYLEPGDICVYHGDYTSGGGFKYSDTNSLILNIKKSPEHRGTNQWYWKEEAIRKCGQIIKRGLKSSWLETTTLVPIPPSKSPADPAYDARITQILQQIDPAKHLDIRELVCQKNSFVASHDTNDRPSPNEIRMRYSINEALTNPIPSSIAIFDDVLTTGAHFKAMKSLLLERFPGVGIVGVFIARRVFPPVFVPL